MRGCCPGRRELRLGASRCAAARLARRASGRSSAGGPSLPDAGLLRRALAGAGPFTANLAGFRAARSRSAGDVHGFTRRSRDRGPARRPFDYSPYWQVLSGSACVSPAANGWTLVTSTAAGTVRVASRWSLTGMIGNAGSCVTGREQGGNQ